MKDKKKIAALIVAAGTGTRFGGEVPKQYQPLMGKPILGWSVDAVARHPLVSDVVVVINPDYPPPFPLGVPTVAGGKDRQDSVRRGLEALRAKNPDIVLIHDAARPLVTEGLIATLIEAVAQSAAAVPGIPITDSVKRHGKTESRDGLVAVQTPQAFDFALIDGLHTKYAGKTFTDDAALCEAEGKTVAIVAGQRDNIKITTAEDLPLAEQYLFFRLGDVRVGTGYDVHKLIPATPDRPLMICGIAVPHTHVLEGHSDADVGLHAITDAILGTIANGDIGMHFSPKDVRWKNADSAQFLQHAQSLLAEKGGVIAHVDLTIVCEEPKIGPHRDKMRARIAEILNLPIDRVSVKATTSESLGFTGRREGIAAQSSVTVRLPMKELS